MYEVDSPDAVTNLNNIYDLPALWRFRARVSLEHLTHELNENMSQVTSNKERKKMFLVLQLFLRQVYQQIQIKEIISILFKN